MRRALMTFAGLIVASCLAPGLARAQSAAAQPAPDAGAAPATSRLWTTVGAAYVAWQKRHAAGELSAA